MSLPQHPNALSRQSAKKAYFEQVEPVDGKDGGARVILMCGSDLAEPGGMTTVCRQLVGHRWPDDIAVEYVPTHRSGDSLRKAAFFVRAYHAISRRLSEGGVAAVHAHMSYKGSFARKYLVFRLCEWRRVPFVLHLHGSEFANFHEGSSGRTKRRIVRMAEGSAAVIALGRAWADFVAGIAPGANVVTLPNAVPLGGAGPRDRHLGTFTFAFLGTLIRRKGVADLLEAFRLVLDDGADARLVVAGDGEEAPRLRQLARSLGVEGRVEFAGWLDGEGRAGLLGGADAFVLPSYNEGLPMALLEAMAAGVPPVVSDVGSVSDAVTDGVEGLLVEPGDVRQIASAMGRLYRDEAFWRSASARSAEKARVSFGEDAYFERLAGIWRSLEQEDRA